MNRLHRWLDRLSMRFEVHILNDRERKLKAYIREFERRPASLVRELALRDFRTRLAATQESRAELFVELKKEAIIK